MHSNNNMNHFAWWIISLLHILNSSLNSNMEPFEESSWNFSPTWEHCLADLFHLNSSEWWKYCTKMYMRNWFTPCKGIKLIYSCKIRIKIKSHPYLYPCHSLHIIQRKWQHQQYGLLEPETACVWEPRNQQNELPLVHRAIKFWRI